MTMEMECTCPYCEFHVEQRRFANGFVSGPAVAPVQTRQRRLEADPAWVAANAEVEAVQAELDGMMQAADREWRTYRAQVASHNAAGQSAMALVEPDQYGDAMRRGELQERLHRAIERRQTVETRLGV